MRVNDSDKCRTALANERTALAYVRTSLAVMVFGMAAVKFFPDRVMVVSAGWFAMGIGLMLLLFGVGRFLRVRKWIGEK